MYQIIQILRWSLQLFLCFLLCNACDNTATPDTTTSQTEVFKTTDPSRLYFKNMRSFYYDESQQSNTKVDVYRLRNFTTADDRPLLRPLIANDWMQDQAYLLLESNNYQPGLATPFVVKNTKEKIYTMANAGMKEQRQLAISIQEAIDQQEDLFIENSEGELLPFLDNQQDRNQFSTVVKDYLRLTEQR